MDMTIIDCTTKLKTADFNKFRKLLKDDDVILAQVSKANPSDYNVDTETVLTVDTFRSFFEEGNNVSDDEDIVTFCTENAMLTTTGAWYKKWSQPSWSSYIFPDKETKTKTKTKSSDSATIFNVAVRYENDDNSIRQFSGTKARCIDWLNQNASIMQIQSFFEKDVQYSINNSEWKTYGELLKEGVIE